MPLKRFSVHWWALNRIYKPFFFIRKLLKNNIKVRLKRTNYIRNPNPNRNLIIICIVLILIIDLSAGTCNKGDSSLFSVRQNLSKTVSNRPDKIFTNYTRHKCVKRALSIAFERHELYCTSNNLVSPSFDMKKIVLFFVNCTLIWITASN